MSLARYASHRGDAERGLSRCAGPGRPPSTNWWRCSSVSSRPPAQGLGRNHPCWCGSGRKYKVCHLHREQLPLAERAAWLYQKAGADLLEGPFGPLLIETALERVIEDGLACDAMLFEGDAFADFLAVRGALLPEDERLLAGQWLLVQRSVHEVVSVRRGEGPTLRDVRTGDVHQVRERGGSRHVKVGELYCARVVPAGDTMQIFGGIEPVSIGERDDLIALLMTIPTPSSSATTLSRRSAPPVLQNYQGGSLMMCDATLRATATASGSSVYTSRTALLTKRRAVRSTDHRGYQACMMRGEMWPRRQEGISRPDAGPPRCAQLMGLASRGCLVLVLGATAERRNLLFRSDLGLPWIRTFSLRPAYPGKAVK